MLSEFDFDIPIHATPTSSKNTDDDDIFGVNDMGEEKKKDSPENEAHRLESAFVLQSLLTSQKADQLDATTASREARAALARMEVEIDKVLLQMLAVECREGEDRGMRALETVGLMRDRTGRMLEAASKVAERYGLGVLGEKIREAGEVMEDEEEEL